MLASRGEKKYQWDLILSRMSPNLNITTINGRTMQYSKYDILCKPFAKLTPQELHRALKLRIDVFMIDQQCMVNDLDDLDEHAHHLLIKDSNGDVIAYLRFFQPQDTPTVVQIGRVVTSPKYQGQGLGKCIMQEALNQIITLYQPEKILLHAQADKMGFYQKLGFEAVQHNGVAEIYVEDGIDHVTMENIPDVPRCVPDASPRR